MNVFSVRDHSKTKPRDFYAYRNTVVCPLSILTCFSFLYGYEVGVDKGKGTLMYIMKLGGAEV